MIMLHGGEPVRKHAHMMIVDQRQCAHHHAIRFLGGLFNQRFANEVAKSLGPVGIAALLNMFVESCEKVGIDGYADAAEVAHLF